MEGTFKSTFNCPGSIRIRDFVVAYYQKSLFEVAARKTAKSLSSNFSKPTAVAILIQLDMWMRILQIKCALEHAVDYAILTKALHFVVVSPLIYSA